MQRSPVARLADAVNWLEDELKRMEDEARSKANELVRLSDLLARELMNDVDLVVHQVVEEAKRAVEEEAKRLEEEYLAKIESEVARLTSMAEANKDKAIDIVVREIKALLGGVG